MEEKNEEYWLSRIGILLKEDNNSTNDVLLYARLEMNVVSTAIFEDMGNHVLYRFPRLDELPAALLAFWRAQAADVRWSEIEYVLRDGHFEASFTYPDEIDPEEDEFVRRDRVVARHFGEKPIHYPPPPGDNDEIFSL